MVNCLYCYYITLTVGIDHKEFFLMNKKFYTLVITVFLLTVGFVLVAPITTVFAEWVRCSECSGRGTISCTDCSGQGHYRGPHPAGLSGSTNIGCRSCGGSGYADSLHNFNLKKGKGHNECFLCRGEKRVWRQPAPVSQ